MELVKINKHIVKPIPLPNADLRPVKGAEICKKPFGTIFNVAKRESGKTSVTFHFIKHCITRDTIVIIFCSSLYNDDNWIQIRKWLKKKGIETEEYTSTIDDNGVNLIQELFERLRDEAIEREKNEDENNEPTQMEKTDMICRYFDKHFRCREESEPQKEQKSKYLAPKYLIIFDDISSELKSPWLIKLLKESRHYHARIIINSQYPLDLRPESRSQINLWLLFRGLPLEKLEAIWKDSDISIPLEHWIQGYKIATKVTDKETHPFFYADVKSNPPDLRRNFNRRIIFHNNPEDETF